MQIQIIVNPNSIHHYIDAPIYDESGIPTGQTKEVLQLDFHCPEYPKLPTYGIHLDIPVTRQQVKDVIEAKVQLVKDQMERDSTIRDSLGTDVLEFTVEVN